MRALVLLTGALVALPLPAMAASPDPHLAPLAFLAGHCWKGAIPGAPKPAIDEHCFSWMYGGKYLRDRHEVRSEGKVVYEGESIYYWNAAKRQIDYFYVTAAGGHAHGTVIPEGDALTIPETNLVMPLKPLAFRGRWKRLGDDAYEVLREYQTDKGWTPVTMRMEKVAPPK